MFNKVILIGRLGQDPEMRYTPGGTAVTNFSIATNKRKKDKNGNWGDETTWHDIVCWGKTAEFINEYAKKGKLVFVEGEIQKRDWEDRNGQKRISVEILGWNIQLLEWGDKPSRGPSSGGGKPQRQAPQEQPPQEYNDTEDDVPF